MVRDRWREGLLRALAGEHVRYDRVETRTEGAVRWFAWEARPCRDGKGDVIGAFVHGRDVTPVVQARAEIVAKEELIAERDANEAELAQTLLALEAAREAAEAASVSKSRFLASMSHELRTPLNAIIGYSEILMEEAEADGRDSDIKDIDRILNSARHLLHLINDILDLSKIEAGKMELFNEPVDGSALVHDVTATVGPLIAKNGNRLQVEVAPDAGDMQADATKLRQILFNLLSNAAKFTKAGAVGLRVERRRDAGGDHVLIVSDTGVGMTTEQVAALFTPFKQGREVRFGIVNSALWATATTAASNGSVNSMHDSYTPLGGLVPLALIQLGEVIFGGVGSGLYRMLIFAVVAVFIAGLMIGRTPEYLGKKIEAFDIKMASLVILIPPLLILGFSALAVMLDVGKASIYNPGGHGLTEVLYAFSSAAGNNGSAFAGLGANTPFYNITLGLAMFFGRFWLMVPVLALAGSLAAKKRIPAGAGTMPTHTPLFVLLLIGVVILVGALTFVPALALGPVVEHLTMIAQ